MIKKKKRLNNRRSDSNDLTRRCIKRDADEWLEIFSPNTEPTWFATSLFLFFFFFFADITTKLQTSSCCRCSCSNSFLSPLHVSSLKPNSRLLCDVLLCLTDSLFPSGCCQANVWSRLMLRAARCIFSLSSPIFKQQQPPLQPPGGMCANSYSPVGSIAITEPLLYPCNCIGSCFLSDQTVSQPPRETRFIILNKGCFIFFLVCFLIERGDSYSNLLPCCLLRCMMDGTGR